MDKYRPTVGLHVYLDIIDKQVRRRGALCVCVSNKKYIKFGPTCRPIDYACKK